MELRNQSMLSIFLEKRKKRNSQVLYETTLYTSYEFSIFLFFFLNKQVKIMLLFLSTIIYTIKICLENITNNIYSEETVNVIISYLFNYFSSYDKVSR